METKWKILIVASLFAAILLTVYSLQAQDMFTFTTGPYRPHIVKDLSAAKVGSVQTIYAADVETLKYSTNGGTSWLVTGTPMLNPLVVATNPSDASIVHVGKLVELWRSADGGATWGALPKLSDQNLVPLRLAVSPLSTSYWLLGADTVKRGSTWTTSLYRTGDGGTNWSAANYFRDNAHSNINDVSFDPTSPGTNKVWVGGSTKPVDQSPDMTNEGSNPPLPTKGVWYSTDNGATWSFIAGSMGGGTDRNVTALAYSNKTGPLVFAATRLVESSILKAKVYQTADNGVNWTLSVDLYNAFQISQVRALEAIPVKPETLIAATDKGFAISTNRGDTWNLRNTGLGDLNTAHQVLVDKNDATGNTIFLATDPTVYKTTDAGAGWSVASGISGIYSWLNSASLAINNGNAHAVGQSFSRIGRFTSGAWESIPKLVGQSSFSGQAVAINPVNTSYANACGDSAGYSAIYVRTDGANGWRRVFTSTVNNRKFYTLVPDYMSSSQRVYAGGNFNAESNFAYSANRGVTWYAGNVVGADGTVPVLSMAIDSTSGNPNSNIIYAGLGLSSGVRKSVDAGGSWPTAQLNGNSIAAIALNVGSASTVYLSSSSYVWKSTDKLATSPALLSPPFTGAKKLLMHPSYPTSANFLWAITGDGQKIYKTGNGGSGWTEIVTTNLPKPLNDLQRDPTSNAFIYVATAGGMYKVNPVPETPGSFSVTGTNCTPCIEGPEIEEPDAPACYPKPQWSANQEADLDASGAYYVERITSADPTWDIIAVTNNTSFIDLNVELSTNCLDNNWAQYRVRAKDAGGNYSDYTGTIRVKAKSVPPPVNAWRRDIPDEAAGFTYELHQNTPNPFNPVTFIQYSLAEDSHVSLKVYDVIGREVITMVDEPQNAGSKSVEFNASQLPSGVYFYRIQTGKFSDIKKMLLVR